VSDARTVGTLGVVLAGGLGARLGAGAPKPLRVVGGLTLLERALGTLHDVCDEVVVVAPAGRALPSGAARRVNDPAGAAGPLAGLVTGLRAAAFDRAIALGVDFPLMRSAALRGLAARLGGGARHPLAVMPAPGGIPQPLAAAYAPDALAQLAAALEAGERSPVVAVRALTPLLLDDAALAALPGGLENFFNVNTPDDLAEAERRLAARAEAGA
jgi:molybdopterin-guanine dinucleotide biosynthesis protein A